MKLYRIYNKTTKEYVGNKKFYLNLTGAKLGLRRVSKNMIYTPHMFEYEDSPDEFEIHEFQAAFVGRVE